VGSIEEQKPQDWDAQWKASFLNAGEGVVVPPFWRIVPPWVNGGKSGEIALKINPGAGFGTGTHETTQLCLQALGETLKEKGQSVLDFGSGSGILSVAAALLGASVQAIEIDPLAIDNAIENARLNGVENQIRYFERLNENQRGFSVVVANILKPVLIEFSRELTARLAPGGVMILSGLIDSDVDPVSKAYSDALGAHFEVRNLGEWRALVAVKKTL
jgi:ribosomal protein L11 methyltransferase